MAVRQGYLYRIWKLDNKKRICIRSSVHSFKSRTEVEGGEPKVVYQNVYTMLEYELSKMRWKANLDQQLAQCLTKEVQDNSSKINRWVVQSLLAGVDQIKFAFVARKTPKDPSSHVILGTYGIDTRSFCNQINLNMQNCWAILQEVIDIVYGQPEPTGEFIFMKDPTKAIMRLFRVTEEEDDEDEPEDEL